MSPFAPRIITTTIPVDKIGEVIGPKGKMINQIQEETGAEIAIEGDGTVYISSEGGEAAEKAKEIIDSIANPRIPKAGETFTGKVVKTTSFGAFVNLAPGSDGLLHISQIRNLANGERIDTVEDVLKEGDTVEVIVKSVDERGKISLAIPGFENQEYSAPVPRENRSRGSREDRDDRDDHRSDCRYAPREDRDDRDDRPRRRIVREDRDSRYDDRDNRSDRSSRYDNRSSRRDDRRDNHYDINDYEDRPRRRAPREDRDSRYDERGDNRSDRSDDRADRPRCGSDRRVSDRNLRYAADDDHYDEYRAAREERAERPRRRIRRDFDPFDED